MAKRTLEDILTGEDESGLLADLKALPVAASSEAQRVFQTFEEINAFIDRNGYIPGTLRIGLKSGTSERMLQLALNGIKGNESMVSLLAPVDRHGLLDHIVPEAPVPASLESIIDSGDELLSTSADDIFTFRSTPQPKAKPERKAERRPCKDFEVYKPLFDACAEDLKDLRRKTIEFKNEQEIKAGEFFILSGAMLYVAEVNDPHLRNGKPNARLRLIFDNGTEGDNLLRSLSAELYKDGPAGRGRRVTAGDDGPLFTGREDVEHRPSQAYAAAHDAQPSERDTVTGEIYVLKSLSTNPQVTALEGQLFKIGFTTGSIEDRIFSAKDDPTFLLAPVKPVKSYRVVNMSTVKMENLLHRFFGDARLDIEITDRFGRACKPREWFLVPIDVVGRAIEMLIDGSIVNHHYDREAGQILPNTRAS